MLLHLKIYTALHTYTIDKPMYCEIDVHLKKEISSINNLHVLLKQTKEMRIIHHCIYIKIDGIKRLRNENQFVNE